MAGGRGDAAEGDARDAIVVDGGYVGEGVTGAGEEDLFPIPVTDADVGSCSLCMVMRGSVRIGAKGLSFTSRLACRLVVARVFSD